MAFQVDDIPLGGADGLVEYLITENLDGGPMPGMMQKVSDITHYLHSLVDSAGVEAVVLTPSTHDSEEM